MKISYNPEQLFDATGVPLSAGRVTLYVHDSDVPLHVYSLSGDVWSDAANPIILDDEGRMDTVWFEAAIVDIKVEKNTDGVYESVDTYQYGFNPPEVKNDTIVYGMDELADANPELGTVTVVGYYSMNDCGPRTYIWDPTCTDPEDGGCIVAGNGHEEGRWLLLSDLEYLPSSYYGILPGNNEANMAAFLSYPERLGQWRIPTPPMPRFLPGTYTTNGSMSSTKRVAFDKGAKFTKLTLSCYSVEVQPNTDYVCDFILTKDQSVAHSSWFRTAERFWACNSAELVQDPTNFFESNEITANRGIAGTRVSGPAMTLAGTGRLDFTNCSIADHALSTDWYTGFTGMSFTDRWFVGSNWDFSTISVGGHHIRVNVSSCMVELANIDDPNVFMLVMAANGQTGLDLEGRSVGTVTSAMPFTYIRNAVIGEAHFTHDIVLENVTCNELYMQESHSALTAQDSSIVLEGSNCMSVTMKGGRLAVHEDIDTFDTGVVLVGVDVDLSNGSITRADAADHDVGQGTALTGCNITGDGDICNNYLYIENCRINDTDVWLIPQGTDSLVGRFIGNVLTGTACLHIVPGIDDHSSMDIYDVTVGQLIIKDNAFNTTLPGLKMPFWAQDMEHRFVKGCCSSVDVTGTTATWVYSWCYQNNTGNCPASYGSAMQNFNDNLRAQISFGSGTHDEVRFCGSLQNVFCLPVMYNDGGSTVADEWVIADTAKACTPYKGLAVPFNTGYSDRSAMFPGTMYLPVCALDKTLSNSMFDVYLGGSSAFVFGGAVPIPAVQ